MRAIVWKDLRQHLPWAVLAFFAFGAGMAAALHWQRSYSYGDGRAETILSDVFLIVTALVPAVWGTALGFLQIATERHADRWALLVHRPIRRSSIFLGKIAAAAILFFVPMGVPFLLAAWWAATPGNVAAPFEWAMARPGTADILAGYVFVFAGMLTALRRVRWYGSLSLPLVAAAFALAFAAWMPEFWKALLVTLGAVLVLGAAAWGSFLAGGVASAQPRACRFALGTCLSASLSLALAFVVAFLTMLFGVERIWVYRQYVFDRQGRVLVAQYADADGLSLQPPRLTDLDGNQVRDYPDTKSYGENILPEASVMFDAFDPSEWSYRLYERYVHPLAQPNSQPDPYWFYSYRDRLALGYSRWDKRLVEKMGPDGFALADEEIPRFEEERVSLHGGVHLAFKKSVYRVDYAARKIEKIFDATDGDVRGIAVLRSPARQAVVGGTFPILVAGNRIHFLREDGSPIVDTNLLEDLSGYEQISFLMDEEGGRYFVVYRSWNWRVLYASPDSPDVLTQISASGGVVARRELPRLENPMSVRTWDFPPLVSAFPPVLSGFLFVFTVQNVDLLALRYMATGLIWMSFWVAASEACALWLARRYAFARGDRWAWVFVCVLLGPIGILTMIALRAWPARVACASCGRKRVVTRETCEHCAAEFPPPARIGTEILP